MIKSRQEFREYQKIERYVAFGGNKLIHKSPPPSYRYVALLRKCEYYNNIKRGLINRIVFTWYRFLLYRLSNTSGISIPMNTCGKGLTLYHHGSIVVNAACQIGSNCCIMNNVNIGANQGGSEAPVIGNDVYIGPGAVIFGSIKIADGCYIGANAVVTKSILDPNSVVVGIPAKIIKKDNIHWWQKNNLNR